MKQANTNRNTGNPETSASPLQQGHLN